MKLDGHDINGLAPVEERASSNYRNAHVGNVIDEVPESGVIRQAFPLPTPQRVKRISSLLGSLKLSVILSRDNDQKFLRMTSCQVISPLYLASSTQPIVSSDPVSPRLAIEKAKILCASNPCSITESKTGTWRWPLCLNFAAMCGYARPMIQSKELSKTY